MLSEAEVTAGQATLTVSSRPVAAGTANVAELLPNGQLGQLAWGGTLELRVTHGQITASVSDTNPAEMNANIKGTVTVSCLVHQLNTNQTGAMWDDETGQNVLTPDEALSSQQCAPLKAWR
jgi:hypothetical protein